MKFHTFRVEGGLGKHIAFSALIPELFEKYGKINIISSYDDIYLNNEKVKNSWGADYFVQNKIELRNEVKELHTHEPYKGDYIFGDIHILKSWCKAYGLDFKKVRKPQIFTSPEIKKQAKEIINSVDNKFFLTQFSGGQAAIAFNPESQYQFNSLQLTRNYPVQMATILVDKLSKLYQDYTFIDFTLPNEPMVVGTKRLVAPYLVYYELCKYAKEIICIDSSLGHFAAGADKSVYLLWNSLAEATPQNYGWSLHNNISALSLIHI